jgi:hypothetical protein
MGETLNEIHLHGAAHARARVHRRVYSARQREPITYLEDLQAIFENVDIGEPYRGVHDLLQREGVFFQTEEAEAHPVVAAGPFYAGQQLRSGR